MSQASRAPSLNTIHNMLVKHETVLKEIHNIDFNTLDCCRDLGRRSALSVITMYILEELKIDKLPQMNQTKLSRFIG